MIQPGLINQKEFPFPELGHEAPISIQIIIKYYIEYKENCNQNTRFFSFFKVTALSQDKEIQSPLILTCKECQCQLLQDVYLRSIFLRSLSRPKEPQR